MKKFYFLFAFIALFSFRSLAQCTPAYIATGAGAGALHTFMLSGYRSSTLIDTLPAASLSSGYANRYSVVSTFNLQQGKTYNGTVNYYSPQAYTGNQIWIDYNNDNIFADSELVSRVFPAASLLAATLGSESFSITIPLTAPSGTHRMRVRNVVYSLASTPGYSAAALSPCADSDGVNRYYGGVTADYSVNIVTLPSCSGVPVAGITAGPAAVCSSTSFDLTLTNDTIASGLRYQWYSAAAGTGAMSPISGATNLSYHSSGITVATDFQLLATCSSGGLHDSSTVLTVGLNSFYQCYCSGSLGGTSFDASIDSVSILGTSLSSAIAHSIVPYLAFPDTGSATANLTVGENYTIYVTSGGVRPFAAYLWIDYNHNGVFDTAEYIRIDSSAMAYGAGYVSFTIPSSADTGYTGLRIRTVINSSAIIPAAACNFETSGQTRDYIVHLGPSVHCGASPYAGVVSPSSSSVCTAMPFFLSSVHYTPAVDIAFQWFSRPTGSSGPFVGLPGGTHPTITIDSQSTSTDYMLLATCPTSGITDTSAVVTVGENPFYLCYCGPQTGTVLNDFAAMAPIDSVAIAGTSLSSGTTDTGLYEQFYPATVFTTATVQQGSYYYFTVNSNSTGNYNAGIWIDYNHNGVFDSIEYYQVATNQPSNRPATLAITIPGIADTGITGFRVRTTPATASLSASYGCSEEFNGATEDYVITIGAGTPCTGTPHSGIVTSSDSSVCPAQPFTLSNAGADNQLGITYQWVSKVFGAPTFSPVTGANSVTFTEPSQAVTTEYALVATCAYSGHSDTTAVATVSENPFYLCYCSRTTGTVLNDSVTAAPIDSFSIAGTSLNNLTIGSTAVYTRYYPSLPFSTAFLQQGNTYTLAINSYGTGAYKALGWIDYNHNGSFDASEYIPITMSSSSGTAATATFNIPTSADTGQAGLRIRTVPTSDTFTASDACSHYSQGATQDYIINISPSVTCLGTPVAGTVTTAVSSVCSGEQFTLVAAGFTSSTGTSYQWIQAPTGSTSYTLISGATTAIYTAATQSAASDYRLVVSCSVSGLSDTSSTLTVGMKPFYRCYCSPVTGVTLNTSASETPIDSVAEVATTLNNYIPGNTTVYQQFYPLTTTTTDSMRQGFNYTIAINSNGTVNYDAGIWLDANQDGVFDSTEYFVVGSNIAPGVRSFVTFRIPVTADTGYTGLRVRTTPHSTLLDGSDACTNEYYGATQDYIVRIAPGVPCSGTPVPGIAMASFASVCSGTSFLLTDTGYAINVGISYQWYSRISGTGTFSAISGATNAAYNVGSQAIATDYVMKTTCALSSSSRFSDTVTVSETPYYSCYCGAPLGTTASYAMLNSVQIPYTSLNITGAYSGPYRSFGRVGDSTAALQRSLPYNLSLNVSGGSTFNAGMWIDYNHDGIFESSEYTRLDTNMADGVAVTSFTIPGTADTGITGIRIRATPGGTSLTSADACTDIAFSQTYDFKITIDTLFLCSGIPDAGVLTSSSAFACPAMTVNLANDSFTLGAGLTYSWVKRNTGSSSFSSISGATTHTYTITSQTVSTDYAIVARCSYSGLSDTSAVLTVTENPFDSCYCSPPTGIPLVASGGDSDIVITDIYGTTMYIPEQTPGATGYVAVPPTPAYNTATLQRGSAYPSTIYVNYTEHTIADAGIWIDYNHNSIFDSAEFTPLTQSSDHSNWAANINIPSTASLGLTGMRVVTTESGTLSASGSCSEIAAGEVQDEIVTITMPPCYSLSAAAVTNITDTNALGTWGRLTGALGYEYVIDNSSSSPTGAGTPTTDTFVHSGCLTSNTTYYLHVRDSCGAGYFSSWITEAFTTLPCRGTAAVTASAITDHSATITWDTVTGSGGYEYSIDTSMAAPTGAGTASTDTVLHLTGLTQGTTYYAHVRSHCPCGNVSNWDTVAFTTICDTIAGLSVFTITDTSVHIKWDSIIGFSDYAYVINTSPATPTGGYTEVTDTSVYVHGLISGTHYYVHVSHACSGAFSTWSTDTFSTPYCDTVTGVTLSADDTGVILHYTGVAGSLGYYYTVNIYSAAPAGTGIFTTSLTDTVTALLSGFVYYAHIRTGCTLGYSSWETVPITTLPCDTVSGLAVGGLCDTSATLTWTAASGGIGYLYAITTTPAPPATGIHTYLPFAILNTLSPGTTYYFHVRHQCSIIDTSTWQTIRFTTNSCDTVTGLSISSITANSAQVNWTGSSCAPGYYCIVNTTPGAPSGTGTYVTTTTFPASALTPGTTYYAHVKVGCGDGATSAWETISFTTLTCIAPASVSISAVLDNSATLTWPVAAGAILYEWWVDTSPSSPTGSGNVTAVTTATDGSLSPLTTYYGHVRSECGVSIYSNWVTSTAFTTTNLSVQSVNSAYFNINAFPNPVTGTLLLQVTGAGENGHVMLTDITGKVMLQSDLKTDKLELDLSQLSAGIYFVRYTDDSHTGTLKINKQ